VISVAEARARLQALGAARCGVEQVPLAATTGRILAVDIVSPIDVPPTDNSAVDGYAILATEAGNTLPVSLRIPAGAVPDALPPGSAARIFTGAAVPANADTVVMQEDCEAVFAEEVVGEKVAGENMPDAVRLPGQVTAGANIRRRGQDVSRGSCVLTAGTRLTPWHAGLLASLGLAEASVYQPLRVALLTTGNELQEPGEQPLPGRIFNSNRTLLTALLQQCGCAVVDLGAVADTPEATRAALQRAAQCSDLVVSTGGVSVGEEDHVRDAVAALGAVELWKVAIKPGKPFAFGRLDNSLFVGLPGNPAAVLVTFLVLVKPLLDACAGRRREELRWYPMAADFSHPRAAKREEYLRVRVADNGCLQPHPNQSSGMLSSACWADGLARVPVGAKIEPGSPVDFLPFAHLMD